MATAKITRRYHKNDGKFLRGDVVTEFSEVPDIHGAIDWAEAFNDMHEEQASHITGVWIDNRNFGYMDLSEIYEAHDLELVEWRELETA